MTDEPLPGYPWQPWRPGMAECTRHRGQCVYLVGDPDRCDTCHRSWVVIERWESRPDHVTRCGRGR
jgi:hypothetical protein